MRILPNHISNTATPPYISLQDFDSRQLLASNADPTSPEQHRVVDLPLANTLSSPNYAGYINIDRQSDSNIFYWLFLAENTVLPTNSNNIPLIIWLNGGPGCSSMDGLFLECGPFRYHDNTWQLNPHSWHKLAHIMFVDQPVGTGLSYTRNQKAYAKSENEVATQFYTFLTKFLQLHHDMFIVQSTKGVQESREIYFAGESHAGHYIPSIISVILQKNKQINTSSSSNNKRSNKHDSIHIRIGGAALGNPWIDPMYQYDVSEYAYARGLISKGQMNMLKIQEKECQSLLKQGRFNQKICLNLLDDVIEASTLSGHKKTLMYDTRIFSHSGDDFPPNHGKVEELLNLAKVRASLHANSCPHRFVECSDPPFNALSHIEGKGIAQVLTDVLDAGIRVLIYSGVDDLIVNHMSTDKMLHNLKWKGLAGFRNSPRIVWSMDKSPVAYLNNYNNLYSLKVLRAGHMVPLDQPVVSLEMLAWFLNSPLKRSSLLTGFSKLDGSTIEYCSSNSLPETNEDTPQTQIVENKLATNIGAVHGPARITKMNISTPEICPDIHNLRLYCSTTIIVYLDDQQNIVHIPKHLIHDLLLLDIQHSISENSFSSHIAVQKQQAFVLHDTSFRFLLSGEKAYVLSVLENLSGQLRNESSVLKTGIMTSRIIELSSTPDGEKPSLSLSPLYSAPHYEVVLFCLFLLVVCTAFRRRIKEIAIATRVWTMFCRTDKSDI